MVNHTCTLMMLISFTICPRPRYYELAFTLSQYNCWQSLKKQLCAGIHCWPPMSSAINQSQRVILSSLRLISVPFWHFQNQVLITCTFVPFLTLSIACVIFYMIIFRQMSAAMGMAQGNEMVQCRQPQRSEASSMRLMLLCSLTKHYIEALH